MRHVGAWVLALAACAGAVAARVLVGEPQPPVTFAAAPAAPGRTHTVTRTHTVVVTVRTAPKKAPARTVTAAAPARRVIVRPVTRPAAPRRAAPKPTHRRRPASPSSQHAEGDAAPTRYGAVQVRLTLRGTRILDVVVLHHPDDLQRSREIDADALPKLRALVPAAQSAQIDGVAGATYTSQGYRQSVQSALDLA